MRNCAICDAAESATNAGPGLPSKPYSGLTMKDFTFFGIRLAIFSAVLVWTLPVRAADDIHANWTDLCRVAAGRKLPISAQWTKGVNGLAWAIINGFDVRTRPGCHLPAGKGLPTDPECRSVDNTRPLCDLTRRKFTWLS